MILGVVNTPNCYFIARASCVPDSPCVLGQRVVRVIPERLGPVLASELQYFSSYGSLKIWKVWILSSASSFCSVVRRNIQCMQHSLLPLMGGQWSVFRLIQRLQDSSAFVLWRMLA